MTTLASRAAWSTSIAAVVVALGDGGHAQARPPSLPFVESGRGASVVLVHGALGDQRQWAQVADILDDIYHVIAISRRCHWPRPCATSTPTYTYESHSDDLRVFLESRAERVHLVGHSYGAGVALLTALRSPALVQTLTLIEPPFGGVVPASASGFAEELELRNALVAAIRGRAEAGDVRRASEMLIDWVQGGAGGFRRLPAQAQETLLANAHTIGPTYGAPPPAIACEELAALRLPVLVLHGERTRKWYRRVARGTADCIPAAALARVEGGSHMIVIENPAGTARAVANFIRRQPHSALRP